MRACGDDGELRVVRGWTHPGVASLGLEAYSMLELPQRCMCPRRCARDADVELSFGCGAVNIGALLLVLVASSILTGTIANARAAASADSEPRGGHTAECASSDSLAAFLICSAS